MARPPNYRFERNERDRAKAAKAARKAAEKERMREQGSPTVEPPTSEE